MDTAVLALRVAASLVAVLGLIWLLAKGARRRGLGSTVDSSRFTVVGRHSVGRNAGVTVLRVGDEALVLGVTERAVELLARTPISAVCPPPAAEAVTVRSVVLPEDGAEALAADPAARTGRSVRGGRTVLSSSVHPGGPARGSALTGSALSPATWTQALEVLRERTTRR